MSVARQDHASRIQRANPRTLRNWQKPQGREADRPDVSAVVDCGWGRLIFAHTFASPEALVDELRKEAEGERDIAFYLRDPHVLLSLAPQELFLDPSHTYRIWFDQYRGSTMRPAGYTVRRLNRETDREPVRRILARRGMVGLREGFLAENAGSRVLTMLVAVEDASEKVIGFVMGVDHKRAFKDPEGGSSLWCLAVDPQARHPGIGEALLRQLSEHYAARGRSFMDLSVMHDNKQAIALYEKLGFQRVPVFAIKSKNPINETLYSGPQPEAEVNPYAAIIINEARRRGIGVEILDAENGYFALSLGGRTIVCRESLSELTSAVAMSRCDDKAVTRQLLTNAGLMMPEQIIAKDRDTVAAFLQKHGRVVVKPARGEQGSGVAVDITDLDEAMAAVEVAGRSCDKVLVEQLVKGVDLRIIVIDQAVAAAAVREPAQIVGNGRDSVERLIKAQSRRRAAATGGESRIPLDEETRRCVAATGHAMDDVPAEGMVITVRKAANLHTGGTIRDVTDELHPALAEAAVEAAFALDIPVVGLDFIVPAPDGPDYAIIEANERPGLANHEPAPTAERFIDLLFPTTVARA
ncbi:MAG: N-acetylglutaminylglutamine synthetase [Alphaproteobacteria bacterium]